MVKIYKPICLTVLICVSFLSGQATASAQNVGAPREPSTQEGKIPQAPSAKNRIWIILADAIVKVLCAEHANGCATGNHPGEAKTPRTRGEEIPQTQEFARDISSLRLAGGQREFSFDTPPGWQTYEDQTSVTVARPSEYVNSDLTNGVMLGLFDLNGASFERGTEAYVRGLNSSNKYLNRVGLPESNVVGNVPCITTRMEGRSPKTQYIENVIVYACKRSTQKLFYVVTVNSGPNANGYEDENRRITQTISFR